MNRIFALFAVTLSLNAHAEFTECVLANVGQNPTCEFDTVQSRVLSANRRCAPELIALLKNNHSSEAMDKTLVAIKATKAEIDPLVTAKIQAEIDACGYQGSVQISNGGSNVQITIFKFNR